MSIVDTLISVFTHTATEYPKNRTPQAIAEILAPFADTKPITTRIQPSQAPSPHRGPGVSLYLQDSQRPPNQLFITASSGDRRQPPFQLFLHALDRFGFSRAQAQVVSNLGNCTITQATVNLPHHSERQERQMVLDTGNIPHKLFTAIDTLLSR